MTVKAVPELTLSALHGHVVLGGAAIVLAAQVGGDAENNHYFLVLSLARGGHYWTVNLAGECKLLVSRQKMREYLRPRRGWLRSVPQGWLLS